MKKEYAALPGNELRRQAEVKLSKRKKKITEFPRKDADIKRLVHELQVHQIELEMQNDELLQARIQLESTLNMYVELYALAPVGYFTLTYDGIIRQANVTGSKLIGLGMNELIGRRLDLFITRESRQAFHTFFNKVFTNLNKEICDIALQKNDGAVPLWVHIVGVRESSGEQCYVIVSEITERNQAGRKDTPLPTV
jgi:PAS domain S-box-containing protein